MNLEIKSGTAELKLMRFSFTKISSEKIPVSIQSVKVEGDLGNPQKALNYHYRRGGSFWRSEKNKYW